MEIPDLQTLSFEIDDGIAFLYMDRPEKRNAMNRKMFEELGTAADYLRQAEEVDVVVMTGRGSSFCSGLDLSSMKEFSSTDVNDFRMILREMQRNFRAYELIEKPVIAMVNGPALGAGTEIALACDMIIASSEAVFGLLEVNLGLVTDLGATQRLPRHVGIHRAKELIMTGKRISADEAEKIGMINAVYPPEELLEQTRALSTHLKNLSSVAVGLCKVAIDRSYDGSLEQGLELEAQSQTVCLSKIIENLERGEQGESQVER